METDGKTNPLPPPVRLRVAYGAALFDMALPPGWVDRIDLDRLAMDDCGRCALGQMFGSYNVGLEELADGMSQKARDRWAVLHGFEQELILDDAAYDDFGETEADVDGLWDELRREWVRLVTERRKEAVKA